MLKTVAWAQCALASLDARKDEGQTLVEYALILTLVSITLIVSLGLLKDDIVNLFKTITDAF